MTALLSKNKLAVYLAGLLLYMAYLVIMIYSGSPLMAGGLPQSPKALSIAAVTDPFGLSAFYQQTNLWTLIQKNTWLPGWSENMLYNRLLYLSVSGIMLLLADYKFSFLLKDSSGRSRKYHQDEDLPVNGNLQPVPVITEGFNYGFQVFSTYLLICTRVLMRSIPFVLIVLAIIGYLSMEFYGSIDQGIRLPEQYATTGLMANRMLYNLPDILLPIVLFYTHELYRLPENCRIDVIELSTPAAQGIGFIAKWMALSVLILLILSITVLTAVVFQLSYSFHIILWPVYGALCWLIAVPSICCAGIALSIQHCIKNKWTALLLSSVTLLLLATSAGKISGLTSPLFHFAEAYRGIYSEMNGWDDYLRAFSWKLCFGLAITILLVIITIRRKQTNVRALIKITAPLAVCCLIPAIYILQHTPGKTIAQENDSREAYERQYRKFSGLPSPDIYAVKAQVALYPEKHAYQVNGTYSLKNLSHTMIRKVLVGFDPDVTIQSALFNGQQILTNHSTGIFELKKPLLPGDTAAFRFSFTYHWDGFTGHHSFQAIVHNGSFIRLSNNFPRFGYQSGEEISEQAERHQRHLPAATPLLKLDAPRGKSEDFARLDMTISTTAGQTAIGTGNLTGHWRSKGRDYFRYATDGPVPFRFGLSSASYSIMRSMHHGTGIEVYYDPAHPENVRKLIRNAGQALDYCRKNFGRYPYPVIRFAEVSAFTNGFAGTAYPGTIFMTEQLIFHANLNGDKEKDVINELAAHELSHQWWGAGQLVPDDREGAKLLTETLAMYTELMLSKQTRGSGPVKAYLDMHRDIYLNERGFGKEEPLYKVKPESIHLYYSKGMMAMYALSTLIGEEKVNKALKNLLRKYGHPGPAPLSTDLLQELYAVSRPEQHAQIDRLFKTTELPY